MKRRLSMRYRIALLYLLTASMLAPIIYLLQETASGGISAQLSYARQEAFAACAELQQRFSNASLAKTFAREDEGKFQDALLEIILDRYDGIEGGFWSRGRGFQGYAFPTYDGASPKKDVPRSEMGALAELAEKAIASQVATSVLREGKREAVLSIACPVPQASEPTAAWVLFRIPISSGAEFDHLGSVSLALLVLLLLTGIGSFLLLRGWAFDLRRLIGAIEARAAEDSPLPDSPEPDLEKIVKAFNRQSEGLRQAHQESLALTKRLGQAERLALLGQMAAGIAHEIRNPIGAIKLKLENAEVNPAERMPKAIPVVMDQIERVDRLVEMLLAFTRPFTLKTQEVDIATWLEQSFLAPRARAAERHVEITMQTRVATWRFDPFHLGRAVENLLQNAVEFSPEGEKVSLEAAEEGGRLVIQIKDSGKGISSEQKAALFQPFATTREGGIGLGLVLAKEIVEAHGGALSEVGDASGACFRVEVPWPKS